MLKKTFIDYMTGSVLFLLFLSLVNNNPIPIDNPFAGVFNNFITNIEFGLTLLDTNTVIGIIGSIIAASIIVKK